VKPSPCSASARKRSTSATRFFVALHESGRGPSRGFHDPVHFRCRWQQTYEPAGRSDSRTIPSTQAPSRPVSQAAMSWPYSSRMTHLAQPISARGMTAVGKPACSNNRRLSASRSGSHRISGSDPPCRSEGVVPENSIYRGSPAASGLSLAVAND
jgi:hypothetical protein